MRTSIDNPVTDKNAGGLDKMTLLKSPNIIIRSRLSNINKTSI